MHACGGADRQIRGRCKGGAVRRDLVCDRKLDSFRIEPFFPLSHGVPRAHARRIVSGSMLVIRNLALTLTRNVPLNRWPVAFPPDGDERAWAATCCPWRRLLLLRAGLDVKAFACLVAALAGRLPSDGPSRQQATVRGIVWCGQPGAGEVRDAGAANASSAPRAREIASAVAQRPLPPATAPPRRGRGGGGRRPSRRSRAARSPGVRGWRARSRRAAAAPARRRASAGRSGAMSAAVPSRARADAGLVAGVAVQHGVGLARGRAGAAPARARSR